MDWRSEIFCLEATYHNDRLGFRIVTHNNEDDLYRNYQPEESDVDSDGSDESDGYRFDYPDEDDSSEEDEKYESPITCMHCVRPAHSTTWTFVCVCEHGYTFIHNLDGMREMLLESFNPKLMIKLLCHPCLENLQTTSRKLNVMQTKTHTISRQNKLRALPKELADHVLTFLEPIALTECGFCPTLKHRLKESIHG
jgi:hypothetical protein